MSPTGTELATIKTNLDATTANLATITSGIAALDTLIQNLQNSPNPLSPADQAALDAIVSQSTALAATAAAISTAPPGKVVPPTAAKRG
jgi:hypothetical protein